MEDFRIVLPVVSPNGLWEITGPLKGAGTFGAVYEGINLKTKERVAMKCFTSENDFEQELAVAESLECASWAPCVLGDFEMDGYFVIVYRLAETDLNQYLKDRNKFNARDIDISRDLFMEKYEKYKLPMQLRLEFMFSMIGSLRTLFMTDIVHRDIKARNVLVYKLNGGMSIGLGDLGSLCTPKASKQFPDVPICLNLSQDFKSTPYSTPARIRDEERYQATTDYMWVDICGTGIVLIEILCGIQLNSRHRPSFLLPIPDMLLPNGKRVSGAIVGNLILDMIYSSDFESAFNAFSKLCDVVGLPMDIDVKKYNKLPKMIGVRKKETVKKSAPKKSAPKKTATKSKKAASKKASKKSAPKKSSAKKGASKKKTVKKSVPKKASKKKSASKKTSAKKKSVPKKSAKKKASKKKTTKKSRK